MLIAAGRDVYAQLHAIAMVYDRAAAAECLQMAAQRTCDFHWLETHKYSYLDNSNELNTKDCK